MKGIDVSAEELTNAREFLRMVSGMEWPEESDFQQCTQAHGELVRLIAWYGAIRAEGGKLPGKLVSKKEEARKALERAE